jgi:hypothetical protein
MIGKGMVVQFLENHKWAGSLGIVTEVKQCGDDTRYMIGVPVPQQGTAYIFSMESDLELQMIGFAVLVPRGDDEDED